MEPITLTENQRISFENKAREVLDLNATFEIVSVWKRKKSNCYLTIGNFEDDKNKLWDITIRWSGFLMENGIEDLVIED